MVGSDDGDLLRGIRKLLEIGSQARNRYQQLPFTEVNAKEIFHLIDYVNAVSNNLCG